MPDDASSGPGGAQVNAKRRPPLRPLLFVIPVVVGALSGLTCDALVMARERARRSRCHSQLNNGIAYACYLYATDYAGAFPPDLSVLYPAYVPDGQVFLCPSAGKATPVEDDPHFSHDKASRDLDYRRAVFGDTHMDYVYVSGLTVDDPGDYVVAFDDEWNHNGKGVHVFCVGSGGPSGRNWSPDIKGLHRQLAEQEKELAAKGRKMKLLRPAWSSWPDPPPDPRPWYARRGGRAVLVGAITALVVALPLIIRTVGRGRKRPAEEG